MKYLVTGGAGFIGSHLCRKLSNAGHEVVVFDDMSSGNTGNLIDAGVRLIPHSMGNYEAILAEARDSDHIIHLAATVGVKATMDNTSKLISNNVNNTDMIFRVASAFKVPVFFASTSEIYGKSIQVPFKEDEGLVFGGPHIRRWAYAQTKALGESLAHYYAKEEGLKFIIGRIFNCVGPGQSGAYGMVLPRFIEAAKNHNPISIYGSGLQTRAFCHVDDTTNAIIGLMESGRFGEAYNIGSTEEVSILELADRIIRKSQSMAGVNFIDYKDAYGPDFEDIPRRIPNINKITEHIGWRPTKNLDDILGEMI